MKNLQVLSFEELQTLNAGDGGAFWYDIAYCVGGYFKVSHNFNISVYNIVTGK